jgi:uncharacterized membrane protein YkvA (DUF1232 family)
MSESDTRLLDVFPAWLRSLGDDAEGLSAVIATTDASQDARQLVAGALNYLFKSLDLIPDGIDDLGYLDDAFVLRTAADLALRADPGGLDADALRTLNGLAEAAHEAKEFLGDNYARLESFVQGLRRSAARGRSVNDIVNDEDVRKAFLSDVASFVKSYEAPSFSREPRNLVKLKAFFDAKLPK